MSALDVRASGAVVKLRRPWVVGALSLIPFYWQFWFYTVNCEMRDFGRARGDAALGDSRPARSVLATTLGAFVIVPALIAEWRAVGRLEACERVGGAPRESTAPILGLLLAAAIVPWVSMILGGPGILAYAGVPAFIVATGIVQYRLTRLWRTVG